LNSIHKNKKQLLVLGIAAFTFLVTAYNSHGYFQADEHYQIIEPANAFLGYVSYDNLSWEIKSHIRPTLQVFVCAGIFKLSNMQGWINPYFKTFLLRLITSILCFWALYKHINSYFKYILRKTPSWIDYALVYLLWFIPLLSVRFNSETWSGLFFLIGLSFLYNTKAFAKNSLIIGVFFGLSFLFRFQMAIAIAGVGVWLLLLAKPSLSAVLKLSSGFTAVLLLGAFLDLLYYGEWEFTSYNYFVMNLIENDSGMFGTKPWYFYLQRSFGYAGFFVSLPLFLAFLYLLFTRLKNPLLWIIVPFILIHSLIPHKEERFLFPIAFFVPIAIIELNQFLWPFLKKYKAAKVAHYGFAVLFTAGNVIGLYAMANKAAGLGRIEITRYVYNNFNDKPVKFIANSYSNPYDPWDTYTPHFIYFTENVKFDHVKNWCDLNHNKLSKDTIVLFSTRKIARRHTNCKERLDSLGFKLETQAIPTWIEELNSHYGGFNNEELIELYRYHPNNKLQIK
jgi:phosphatidylinositol glycan class B